MAPVRVTAGTWTFTQSTRAPPPGLCRPQQAGARHVGAGSILQTHLRHCRSAALGQQALTRVSSGPCGLGLLSAADVTSSCGTWTEEKGELSRREGSVAWVQAGWWGPAAEAEQVRAGHKEGGDGGEDGEVPALREG